MQNLNKLQPQAISIDVIQEKYCKNQEKEEIEIFKRVSKKIASAEKTPKLRSIWEKKFVSMMHDGAIGGGRIMATAGTDIKATLMNCFSGDTVVITRNGPKLLKSVVNSEEEVYTIEGWKKASFKSFGVQEIVEIKLSNNQTIKTTAGHEWLTVDRENVFNNPLINSLKRFTTMELLGKELPISPIFTRPDKNDDYYAGLVHGMIYGDGSKVQGITANKFYIHLFGEKMQLAEYFKKYSQNANESNSYGQPSIRIYGTAINNSDLKEVPGVNKTLSYLYGFISGLIATDGSVCKKTGSVTVFQSNLEDIDLINTIINKIGMSSSSTSLYRELSPYNGEYKPSYVIRIRKESISDNDFIRADQKRNFTFCLKRRFRTVNVESVNPTGVFEEVYCAVQPETRTFTIEGNILTGNCYVIPVGDSIIEVDDQGLPGIYMALAEAAETLRRGGGVGYDFSNIRPLNAYVKGTASFASGPCSYMDVFDKSCGTVESAGSRRGAQLGALRIDHPDVEDFIIAKRTEDRWSNFNVSVFVTDAFIDAVKNDQDFQLVHKAKPTEKIIKEQGAFQREDKLWVYRTVRAIDLWEKIMKSNYEFAEPGILFADNINGDNNLRYCENITATNPCAEQPLPPYGCCDLGAIILPQLVSNPFKPNASFDFEKLRSLVTTLVRFLDNALDVTYWPLEKQKIEAMNKRRIGLGYTGIGNTLAMLNLRYDSDEGREMAATITRELTYAAYYASIALAKEKGPFPFFDCEKYLEEGTFASRLPRDITEQIRLVGIRNSHLTTIAPTGTISLAFADNASNGIEPPFSLAYTRKKRKQHGGNDFYTVVDHSVRVYLASIENRDLAEGIEKAICSGETEFDYRGEKLKVRDHLPKSIVTAMEMKAEDHLAMLKVVRPYIDSAISKTVNVPAEYPFEDFKNIYLKAHEYGLKGVATYRPNTILGAVLSEIKKEEPKATETKEASSQDEFDIFMNKVIHQLPNEDYLAHRKRIDYIGPEGKDNFYILVSIDQKEFTKDGKTVLVERPVEVFIETNPDNVPGEWVDSLSRNLSLLARSGINMFCKALDNCKKAKSDKGRIRYGWITKADGSKVPRYHASQIDCVGFAIKEILQKRGIINEIGKPYTLDQLFNSATKEIITEEKVEVNNVEERLEPATIFGKVCEECGAAAVIKKDGCDFCTNCGVQGSCG